VQNILAFLIDLLRSVGNVGQTKNAKINKVKTQRIATDLVEQINIGSAHGLLPKAN